MGFPQGPGGAAGAPPKHRPHSWDLWGYHRAKLCLTACSQSPGCFSIISTGLRPGLSRARRKRGPEQKNGSRAGAVLPGQGWERWGLAAEHGSGCPPPANTTLIMEPLTHH